MKGGSAMSQKTAVFVHAYCLFRDGSRLTVMSEVSTKEAVKLILKGEASYLILSAAYHTWRKETELKKKIATEAGVALDAVIVITEVTDSYDEARKALEIMRRLRVNTLIVVADKWHIRRAAQALRFYLPGVKVVPHPITTPRYEFTAEPSRIKSVRAGYAPLWILWNFLLYLLAPFLLRKQ